MTAKGRSLKVGVFVLGAVILTTIIVFLIGDNRRVWDRKNSYHAKFKDVVGLRAGSPVRMGGVDVGSVSEVRHATDPSDPLIYVTVDVARSESDRVHRDTKARIVNKGLLGDKMVVLEGGTGIPAHGDAFIDSEEEPKDFGRTMDKFEGIAAKADETMEAVRKTSEKLADPQLAEDLRGSVKSMRTILDGVANKNGTAHRLIFDEEEATRVDHILANLDATMANMNAVSANAKEISERAKAGPGLVHALVYDENLANGTTGTMVELNKSLAALRTSNGIGHALIYGDDSTQHVMGNVSKMSDDLREIVANVKAGRGTLGGLLVDPSVYEDIKSLVGNVERNQVLRALVRYSIKQNEEARPAVEVKPETK